MGCPKGYGLPGRPLSSYVVGSLAMEPRADKPPARCPGRRGGDPVHHVGPSTSSCSCLPPHHPRPPPDVSCARSPSHLSPTQRTIYWHAGLGRRRTTLTGGLPRRAVPSLSSRCPRFPACHASASRAIGAHACLGLGEPLPCSSPRPLRAANRADQGVQVQGSVARAQTEGALLGLLLRGCRVTGVGSRLLIVIELPVKSSKVSLFFLPPATGRVERQGNGHF